ncbi:MAG TPA: hypothetical protein VN616_17770, partial [Puia sp.]|nr:hypothetical protein [Puia sp.]
MPNRNLPILTLFLLTAATARSQHWRQQVDYSIDVTLTDSTHTLDGFVRMHYVNHSPDTLSYIWMRCWPNAFKDDRTAFSEGLIRYGRTDFYFSGKAQKGYINRLGFRVDGQLARTEDHPRYIDLIRVSLPRPLAPGGEATLSTPFHVQLPDNYSHFGYHGGIYEIANWYPSPAVYDTGGWHPRPYLDGGGVYSEFGNFDVRITVPAGFIVAASGEMLPDSASAASASSPAAGIARARTLRYHGSNLSGFAWFASRRFRTDHDTLGLPSGRVIDLYSLHRANAPGVWKYGLAMLKSAIRFYNAALGEYPFHSATVVETLPDAAKPVPRFDGGAAYPGIVCFDGRDSGYADMRLSLVASVGDCWLSVAAGTDGRRYPWMTQGIRDFYLKQYLLAERHVFPRDIFHGAEVNTQAVLKDDQPVSTPFEALTPENRRIIIGYKTSIWLSRLRRYLGADVFDSCVHTWFKQQQSGHGGPGAFKTAFAQTSARNLDSVFGLLGRTGPVPPDPYHQKLAVRTQLIPHAANSNRLNISPAAGFNDYDHVMVGAMVHNFNLPPERFQVLATALYGTVSQKWNGLFRLNYSWYPDRRFRRIDAGVNGSRFSTASGTDSNGHAIYGGFYKIVPYLRFFFPRPSIGSTRESWLEYATFFIGESTFDNYVLKSTDSLYYPTPGKYKFRYLNQLSYTIRDHRVLYPYTILVQALQAEAFYRINLDINYLFNYVRGGGLDVRLFGAKFGYLGTRDPGLDLTPYEPKLTALRGTEDYTYQDYFIGRNQFSGIASQQILERDGNLHLRTDLFQSLQGRSDDWVGAINITSTLPRAIAPKWLPLRLFLDIGTYAQAWQDNPPTSHFLYVGGFELALFNDVLRIYAP